MIRVLVVDDSAFARKVVREVLERAPDLEVVGTARDGLDALEQIAALQPDVVTLDLVMPGLDGVGVLRALPAGGPRVVVVSISDADSELAIDALEAGALDLVQKPTALATDRLYDLGAELVAKVRAAAVAHRPEAPVAPVALPKRPDAPAELVLVGTSTGGPQALTRLVGDLPANLPVPVAIALHIPPGYTDALARRLDGLTPLDVVEAEPGLVLRPGLVVLARGGEQLWLEGTRERIVAEVGSRSVPSPYRPSVDLLFESAAAIRGVRLLGVVLTGMGEDGTRGAGAIQAAGGRVLTEDPSSAVIDGMPRRVREAGWSDLQLPIDQIGAAIARLSGV